MADYREISQQYAQGGIKACILINAGAAVALLSQANDLIIADLAGKTIAAMLLWSLGVVLGAFIWMLAFLSTRHVDKSTENELTRQHHISLSNKFMFGAQVVAMLSLASFVAGCISLACGLGSL